MKLEMADFIQLVCHNKNKVTYLFKIVLFQQHSHRRCLWH